jgi:hypothetical protein
MLSTKDGRSLKDLLLGHPAYSRDPQAVEYALKFLERLALKTVGGDGEADERGIGHKEIQNALGGRRSPAGESKPTDLKDALIELGLLVQTEKALPPLHHIKIKGYRPRTASYKVSKTFISPFQGASFDWVEKWFTNPEELPKSHRDVLRKRLSKARRMGDVFAEHHEELMASLRLFDFESLRSQRGTTEVGVAVAVLGQIARSDFKPICSIPSKDSKEAPKSRLANPLSSFPGSLRRHLRVADKLYAGEVDIRACWPTFLAPQLLKTSKERGSSEELKVECARWQSLFADRSHHPREVIRMQAGLRVPREQMKSHLIVWMNGSIQAAIKKKEVPKKTHLELSAWFESNYPAMHAEWERVGPNRLGASIGANFETPLMTDRAIFDYAKAEGLWLSYTFDGFSVFAARTEEQVLAGKLKGLCNLMQQISIERFGIPVVVLPKHIS